MKAIFFQEHGPISVLRYGSVPDPVVRPGEALIKVHFCALNRLDIWVRTGWKGLKVEFPHITGSDIVGELVELNGVSKSLKIGDKVFVNPGVISSFDEWVMKGEPSVSPGYKIIGEQLRGGLAEYVVVPIQNVLKLPDNRDPISVCCSILCGMTVWRMLFSRAHLKPGESVLVVGAGGGVNSLCIQICKKIGCYVIALAGGKEKVDLAYKLGADLVLDYKKNKTWHLAVLDHTKSRGVDIVVDNVGKNTIQQSIIAVKRGGRIVTVGNTSGWDLNFDNRYLFAKQVSIIGSTMGSELDLVESQNFLHREKITPVIHQIFELKDGIKALKVLESGKHFGKIVINVP
ncbi:MAG: zinc-binding dehydrogenase [Deltaproteobacteria bacterium]|nr:zinc-binding dehydrogenase [Deltaproteobacteria bacterium]MCX7952825.1 zinc-binding dehydrogenase [Deltaproteobacteria bacterium]